MKKFILTLLLTLFSSLGALAQTKLYESCRSDSQFECVFIGKAMLRMVNSHKLHVQGMDLNTVIEKLESIEVISTEKAKRAPSVTK